jgi:hypothetical protein
MKKQILILLIAVIAITSTALGQSLKNGDGNLTAAGFCLTPTPLNATCVQTSGPLNPLLGISYTYSVTVTPTVAAPGYIHWFVTTNPNIITAGTITAVIEASPASPYIVTAGTTYNDNTNVTPTVDITWESVPAAGTDLFLVTYVKKNDGCTDNIKVYKIEPQHTFTLDVAYITPGGAQTAISEDCVAPVYGAEYDVLLEEMVMDYGTNHVFFIVNAANFAHSWMPTFEFVLTGTPDNGLTASSTVAVDWAYPADAVAGVWNGTTAVGDIYTPALTDVVFPAGGAAYVDSDGECIIVRITFDHNQNETTMDIPFTFAVDGIMRDKQNNN